MFGDDDDSEGDAFALEGQLIVNNIFTCIVKHRLKTRQFGNELKGDLNIGYIAADADNQYIENVKQKLVNAKFKNIFEVEDTTVLYDILLLCYNESNSEVISKCLTQLLPGGFLMTIVDHEYCDKVTGILSLYHYIVESVERDTHFCGIVSKKAPVICNTKGALYWANAANHIENEKLLVDSVTTTLTSYERCTGIFSDYSINRCVEALSNRGVCIIRGMFNPDLIASVGNLVEKDLKLAKEQLLKRGIDLTKPGMGGPMINNYHELSMREALRVDLRNGSNMNSSQISGDAYDDIKDPHKFIAQKNHTLRYNDNIQIILDNVMNPKPTEIPSEFVGGNWGRWNFGGKGPDAPPPPAIVGEIGSVVTMPGCLDQTIHSDTAHLFDHVQVSRW